MPPKIDMVGKKFGMLTVISENGRNKKCETLWTCKCDCGNIVVSVCGYNLRKGHTKSCGCITRNATHKQTNTRIYSIWQSMKQRCSNPKDKRFKYYGGRGITVCEDWQNSFEAFYDWAMSNGYADNLTIDRIDVNGNYEPLNCRWATKKEQANNRRDTVLIEIDGTVKTISQWSEESGVVYKTIQSRYFAGKRGFDLICQPFQQTSIKRSVKP